MNLNYSKLPFDSYDKPEVPELLLQTMAGDSIGILSNVSDINFSIKFNEPSELAFAISAYNDGVRTPHYDDVSGFRVIYTRYYGVYLILEPETTGDGLEEKKQVTAYSIEKELEYKQFFLAEGTYKFDKILDLIMETANGWQLGHVDTAVLTRYRTFDDDNDYLLSFIYNTVPEKYRCVFSFDCYNSEGEYRKIINVYDADTERSPIPIYLDFDTIMESLEVKELSNELVTAIQPYGADDLDIRAVNPIGSNWIYDLSWFIANGDIPSELATKWTLWQNEILANQENYRGLVSMRASATSRLLTEKAALADLDGELESITIRQNTLTQQLAEEITEEGKRYCQEQLDALKTEADTLQDKIEDKEDAINSIQEELDDQESGYNVRIKQIVSALSLKNYFTEEEQSILKRFFIEQTLEDETFVASDVDVSTSGKTFAYDNCEVSISDAKITRIDYGEEYARDIYSIEGGDFTIEPASYYEDTQTAGEETDSEYIHSFIVDQPIIYYAGTDVDFDPDTGLYQLSGTIYSRQVTDEELRPMQDVCIFTDDEEYEEGMLIPSGCWFAATTEPTRRVYHFSAEGNLKIVCRYFEWFWEWNAFAETTDESTLVSITRTSTRVDVEPWTGEIIRGTLEAYDAGNVLLSLYIGNSIVNEKNVQSGLVTLTGDTEQIVSDVRTVTDQDVTTMEGTSVSFVATDTLSYVTANVSDYQKYSVQMDLFDYAVSVLSDKATPTFDFQVDSANFIFTNELAPFRKELSLGRPIYLRLHNGEVIHPILIEFEVSFEDRSKIELIFSNRFKRPDNVNTLKDMIETSYSSSHKFEVNKYIYNKTADQASQVSRFMTDALDTATRTIIGSRNQTVLINGAGIQIGGKDSPYQMRLVDRMLAISDDGWQTAKLAIGYFNALDNDYSEWPVFTPTTASGYFGVNADLLAGHIMIGNNLVLENELMDAEGNPTGIMQFKVDGTGAWMYNSRLVLQKDNGGIIMIDPEYGIAGGGSNLGYSTDGTHITPDFINTDEGHEGEIRIDDYGMPENANFYMDMNGNVYLRGKVQATSGKIGGWTIDDYKLWSGSGNTYVALNSSGSNDESAYAFWAGNETPGRANFWVKRDGTFHAEGGYMQGEIHASSGTFSGSLSAASGTFSGTLEAAKIKGNLEVDSSSSDGGWLVGCGIKVGEYTDTDPVTGQTTSGYNFYVDGDGNVTIRNGSISFAAVSNGSSTLQDTVNALNGDISDCQSDISSEETNRKKEIKKLAMGEYTAGGTSFINAKSIYGPTIYTNDLNIFPDDKSDTSGGLYIYSASDNSNDVFHISYTGLEQMAIGSEQSAQVSWRFSSTLFYGSLDFSGAESITGLYAKFG